MLPTNLVMFPKITVVSCADKSSALAVCYMNNVSFGKLKPEFNTKFIHHMGRKKRLVKMETTQLLMHILVTQSIYLKYWKMTPFKNIIF